MARNASALRLEWSKVDRVIHDSCGPLLHQPEGPCRDCGEWYHDWTVPHDLWNEVVPDDGLLCFFCFSKRWTEKRRENDAIVARLRKDDHPYLETAIHNAELAHRRGSS